MKMFNHSLTVVMAFGWIIQVCNYAAGQNIKAAQDAFGKGAAFLKKDLPEQSLQAFTEAIRLDPSQVAYYIVRGDVLDYYGKFELAMADYDAALRVNPLSARAYMQRATALADQGKYSKAISDFMEAIRLGSIDPEYLNSVGWVLATCPEASCRNGQRALELARQALELRLNPTFYDTLAAAYAETGDFTSASKWQQVSLGYCRVQNKSTAAAEYRLSLYRQRKPYRQYPIPKNFQRHLYLYSASIPIE